MMGNFYNYGFGDMYGFGWIFMIIFWGLLIWGAIALIKSTSNNEGKDQDKALAILKERYAKSEISKGEYEEKKKDLLK